MAEVTGTATQQDIFQLQGEIAATRQSADRARADVERLRQEMERRSQQSERRAGGEGPERAQETAALAQRLDGLSTSVASLSARVDELTARLDALGRESRAPAPPPAALRPTMPLATSPGVSSGVAPVPGVAATPGPIRTSPPSESAPPPVTATPAPRTAPPPVAPIPAPAPTAPPVTVVPTPAPTTPPATAMPAPRPAPPPVTVPSVVPPPVAPPPVTAMPAPGPAAPAPPAIGAPSAPSTPPPVVGRPVTGSLSPRDIYQAAYIDYSRGSYSLAIAGFREFVRRYPDHELAGNAQYWIGEAYLGLARGYEREGQSDKVPETLEQAVQEFNRVLANYPRGEKAPAALYREALALSELRQPQRARERLQYLVDNFPQSAEAPLARERLQATGPR